MQAAFFSRHRVRAASLASAVVSIAALSSGVAQASVVHLGPVDLGDLVEYYASAGETNDVTVDLTGSVVVIRDTGATITTSNAAACVISDDGHTASCTPSGDDPPLVQVGLRDGDDTLVNNGAFALRADGFPRFAASGGPGADELTGSSTADSLYGDEGDDIVRGMGGDDRLLDFSGGNDQILGGDGHDRLEGGDGDDELRGGAGSDALDSGPGQNIVDGGPGVDIASYSRLLATGPTGPDKPGAVVTLDADGATTGNGVVGVNSDTILALEDVNGTGGADTLRGSSLGNVLDGRGGNDKIFGGGGFDSLFGGSGDDAIDSMDAGTADRVNCGAQAGDTATVDDVDQVVGCPDEGAGLTVVDTTPPETTIDGLTIPKTPKGSVTLSFSGSDSGSAVVFECKLDGGAFAPCESPHTYTKLKRGGHTVQVRAKDVAGNVDPTPAMRAFTM